METAALEVRESKTEDVTNMERLHLWEILQYLDPKQESIQVCFEGEGWEEYVEVLSGSAILKPFREWEIECLGADLNDSGLCRPIIRVSLREA